MLDKSCSACNRLSREYASATAEHLKLKNQMSMALYDSGLYEIAKRAAEVAEQRQELRESKCKTLETASPLSRRQLHSI